MDEHLTQNNNLDLPLIGAQVFIEPGQTPAEIDSWFRVLHENQLPVCRIRLFENYMRTPDGGWDFDLFDQAFRSAEKYGIQILGTLFPATPFTDVGGFKFPHTAAHLDEVAAYIRELVSHYRTSPALLGWVLINEPGSGALPDEDFTWEVFQQWQDKQPPAETPPNGYQHFDFAEERFLVDYNTWYLTWLAAEVHHHDPGRHLHVNNHAIFQLAAEYDFPAWRTFLTSLGGSAHASWHFSYFRREQYALAMAADCEIIRSGAGPIPWLMTEIQGGNNIYSGFTPMCPTREEIYQWLWTILGSGGKGGIFWCLNPRASGFEAGEWALLDFQDQPSDRLLAAAAVSQVVQDNPDLFTQGRPVEVPIHLLYIRESLWVESRLQRGGVPYDGRKAGGVMKSTLGYFETLSEMGVPCQLSEIGEFDFSWPDYQGVTLILAHQVSLPSRYWADIEVFVERGGKLILSGLTAYYDEYAQCVMKTGFPLEAVCGARVREFKLVGNLFEVELNDPELVLPGHLWQGELDLQTAAPAGFSGGSVIAARNHYGRGEVLWVPANLGLGARLDDNAPLADLLYREAAASLDPVPFRFIRHQPGVLSRTLQSSGAYLTVLINKNPSPVVVEWVIPETLRPDSRPEVLFSILNGEIKAPDRVELPPEETLVLKWELK